jgi:hypothetical protein
MGFTVLQDETGASIGMKENYSCAILERDNQDPATDP